MKVDFVILLAALPSAATLRGTDMPSSETSIGINDCNDRQIFRLLSQEAKRRDTKFESCLDVGCGMNPVADWFRSFSNSQEARYYAIDSHPEVKKALGEKDISVIDPGEVPAGFSADLVIAQEVLEHVPQNEIGDFLSRLKDWSNKALAITVPNFSGYDVLTKRAFNKELRFVPDHLKNFYPDSHDPYMHKTATTPAFLAQQLKSTFPEPEYSVLIYRAWPWLLSDMSTGRSFHLYFKVFATIWRNRQ